MRVNRADLGPLKKLAEGGFGKVYRVPSTTTCRVTQSAIAYKEFTKEKAEQAQRPRTRSRSATC